MNEFASLPLTATQVTEEPIDPDFSVPDQTVIPSPDEIIDPDFSVPPTPIYPDNTIRPDYPPFVPTPIIPSPIIPCIFCNNDQWIQGGIRLLNAATGYNAFTVYIDNRPAYSGLSFSEITRYRQITQGYHTFTVMGANGFTYLRKSLFVGDGMATIAIINSANGIDLTSIADTTCPTVNGNACFRVCNLAYYSGPVNVALGNIYFNAVNFKEAASFSPMVPGNYIVRVARSARPETTLITTTITMNPRRIYTFYILNWNSAADTIQSLLVEDRRN